MPETANSLHEHRRHREHVFIFPIQQFDINTSTVHCGFTKHFSHRPHRPACPINGQSKDTCHHIIFGYDIKISIIPRSMVLSNKGRYSQFSMQRLKPLTSKHRIPLHRQKPTNASRSDPAKQAYGF